MSEPSWIGCQNAVIRLTDAVFGHHRQRGLIDDVRRQGKRLDELERFKREIILLWELVRWLILSLATLVGFLLSPSAGEMLGRLTKAAAILSSSQP